MVRTHMMIDRYSAISSLKISQQKNQNLLVVLNIVLHYLRNIQIRPFVQSLK